MEDLTQKLLSFDKHLDNKKILLLNESARIRIEADKEYEKYFTLKKEKFKVLNNKYRQNMTNDLEDIESKEKESFLNLKIQLKEHNDLNAYASHILDFIKKDLCNKKGF